MNVIQYQEFRISELAFSLEMAQLVISQMVMLYKYV